MCIEESGGMGLRIRRDGVVAFLFAICIDTRGSALEWALHICIFWGGRRCRLWKRLKVGEMWHAVIGRWMLGVGRISDRGRPRFDHLTD